LESIYLTNSWSKFGGKTTYFSAENDGVGLPTVVIGDDNADAFDRFSKFNKAEYDTVFARLVDGSVDPIRTIDIEDPNGYATSEELTDGLNLVKVSVTTR
jgi:basic membrane protein A